MKALLPWLLLVLGCGERRLVLYVTALDDGSALVQWRSDDEPFVSHLDRDGSLDWTTRVADNSGGNVTAGLAVHGRSFSVAGRRGKELLVEGFSFDGGTPLWQTSFGEHAAHHDFFDPLVSHDTLDVIIAGPDEVVRLDPQTGQLRARFTLPFPPSRVARAGGRMAMYSGGELFVADDAVLVHREQGSGCAAGDDYFQMKLFDRKGPFELVRWPHFDRSRSVKVGFRFDDHARLLGCLQWRRTLVLVVQRVTESSLVFLDEGQRTVLELGGVNHLDPITEWFTDVSAVGGVGTRFVPFLTRESDGSTVTVVDLELRRIVSRRRVATGTLVFRVDSRWYLGETRRITMLDGETGQIRSLLVDGANRQISPASIAGGVIWLSPDTPRRDFQLARIDAATLDPIEVPDTMGVFRLPDGM